MEKEPQTKPIKLHLGALAVAMFFLWNPFFSMFDILPDVIGYGLILRATYKIADLSPSLSDGRERFQKLLWLSILKPVLQLLLIIWQSRQSFTDKGLPVVVLMTVAGFEAILWVMAFRELFAGLDFLGMRYDGSAVFANQKDVISLTTISGVARGVLCVLPELGNLFGGEYSGNVSADEFDIARYSGILQIANFLLGGLLGVVWLVFVFRYFHAVAGETRFVENLKEAYRTDVLPNTGLFVRRGIHTAFTMLLLGGIGMLDFFIDGINIIPDFLAGIFLTIGLMLFAKRVPLLWGANRPVGAGKWIALVCGVLSVGIGAVHFKLSVDFSDAYYGQAVVRGIAAHPEAQPLYWVLLTLSILQALLLATLCTLAFFGMLQTIRLHMGNALGDLSERTAREDAFQRKEQRKRLCVTYGIAMAFCLSKLVYGILFCDFTLWWLPHLILGGVCMYHIWTRQGDLFEKVEYKYL